jgi:hypothetical protein
MERKLWPFCLDYRCDKGFGPGGNDHAYPSIDTGTRKEGSLGLVGSTARG